MAFRQIPLNEFLAGNYEKTFRQNDPSVHPDLWQPYNPNADYGAATGDYAGAGGPNQQAWMAQRVLGGKTPEAYFDQYNRSLGIDPTTFTDWRIGGARYDPATGMVTQSDDMGGDPLGPLVMGGTLGFLGGVGGLGSLSGITGGADLGAGGLGTSVSGYGFGTPESLIGADVGGLGATGGGSVSSILNPSESLQSFIGDPALGGLGGTTEAATSLAPTQNLGTGGLYSGGTTGGLGSTLGNLGTPSMPPADTSGITETGTAPATPATPAATTTATGTPLSRVLEALTNGGTPTMADILSIGGTLGSTLLGMYGSNQQADSLRDLANQARADRQPFLNKSLEWLNDPAAYAAGPGKASLDAVLRGLSVQGNPFGNPASLALAGDIANRNWQNAVTGFGNIGLSGQDSRNQILSQAINADSGALNSLGYGLENIFNPKPQNTQLNNLMRQFGLV